MIDLGVVRPGSTIRVPFASYDKDDGASLTMTNYAAADILIWKDGSTTERASTAGFTATTDFDGKTGKHLAIIDLADDTTADFFKAGSEYLVAIDAVTVDGVTTGGWIARFRIGYPNAYFDTSIATLASQTSFTLTAGPAEDDALNGMVLIVHDKASAIQVTRVVVEDYTGSTKTVTLRAAPATTFTIAAGDNVSGIGFDAVDVRHVSGTAVTWSATRGLAGTALPAAAADAAGGLIISDAGGLDLDAKLANTNEVTAARMGALTDLINGGRLDLLIDAIKAQTDLLPSDPADASVVAGLIATAQTDLTTLVGRLTALRAAALDEVTSARMGALTDWINGGRLDLLLDAVKAVTDALPNAGALTSLAQDATVAKASALSTAQTSIDDLPTNAELATALATADDAVLAAIAALNNLSQANVRTALGMASANLDTQLADLPTNAELATALGTADDAVLAAIAALNNLSAAQVNAEMVDVLRTDTGTEVSAVPAAAAAIAAQIQFLFQALRNKVTVSATAKTISNDAGTTVGTKTLSDDGTTYQEGEMA